MAPERDAAKGSAADGVSAGDGARAACDVCRELAQEGFSCVTCAWRMCSACFFMCQFKGVEAPKRRRSQRDPTLPPSPRLAAAAPTGYARASDTAASAGGANPRGRGASQPVGVDPDRREESSLRAAARGQSPLRGERVHSPQDPLCGLGALRHRAFPLAPLLKAAADKDAAVIDAGASQSMRVGAV
jgi:hypothetical protein